MSKSELGTSYSFWLPWDDAGGPRTEVGLICRFEPKGGAVVTSEQTKQRLPGTEPVIAAATDGSPKPPKLPEGVSSKPAIQSLQTMQAQPHRKPQRATHQANYEVAAAANGGVQDDGLLAAKKMSATTITLPNNFTMPSAATLMAQNPGLDNAQAASQGGLRVYPGQPALQQTPSTAAATVQAQTANTSCSQDSIVRRCRARSALPLSRSARTWEWRQRSSRFHRPRPSPRIKFQGRRRLSQAHKRANKPHFRNCFSNNRHCNRSCNSCSNHHRQATPRRAMSTRRRRMSATRLGRRICARGARRRVGCRHFIANRTNTGFERNELADCLAFALTLRIAGDDRRITLHGDESADPCDGRLKFLSFGFG